jgi:hypothetical protein
MDTAQGDFDAEATGAVEPGAVATGAVVGADGAAGGVDADSRLGARRRARNLFFGSFIVLMVGYNIGLSSNFFNDFFHNHPIALEKGGSDGRLDAARRRV